MLTEKQIRKDLTETGRLKRKALSMQKKCKKGGRAWNKHRDNVISLSAGIRTVKRLLKGNWIDFEALKTKKEVESFVYKMRQIKTVVRETLKYDVESRDDDNLLCFKIWEKQGSTPNMTYKTLQAKLLTGKFASPESIGRARRGLQEKHPTLRGKLYDKRHQADERFRNQYKLEF